MTIKSHLTKKEALKLFNKINNIEPILLKLDSESLQTYDKTGFNALIYNVTTDIKPEWWPEDAHVSFQYKYNQKFTNDEIKFKPYSNECFFNKIIVMKCTGHHNNWIKIQSI